MDDSINIDEQEEELTKIFIRKSIKMRKRFHDALLRSTTCEDQGPARSLRSAVYSINDTIAALKNKTARLSDVKRFHLNVTIPCAYQDPNITVSLEISQKPGSMPLPLGYFVEIHPPVGDPIHTTLVKQRNQLFQFDTVLDLGERTVHNVNMLRKSEIEFRILQRSTVVGKTRNTFNSLATVPLSSLAFQTSSSSPLLFLCKDGSKSRFAFDVRMTATAPLVVEKDIVIDETFEALQIIDPDRLQI